MLAHREHPRRAGGAGEQEDMSLPRASKITLCGVAAVLLALCWLTGGLVPAAFSAEAAAPAAGDLLSLDVTDTPLKTVVQLLMRDSGINIILASNDKMNVPITATLKNLPLETILKSVLASAGLNYARTEDGTYLIGAEVQPAAPPDKPEVAMPVEPAAAVVAPVVQPEPRRRSNVEMIRLQNISPKDAMSAMGLIRAEDAFSPNPRPTVWRGPAVASVPVDQRGPRADLYDFSQPVVTNTNPYGSTVNINVPPAPAAPTTDAPNAAIASRAGEVGATASQYRPTATRPTTTTTTRPGTTGTTGTTSSTEDSLLPDGVDRIFAYPEQNALLVMGDDEGVAKLKDLITQIDLPPRQVIIKAEFVQVRTEITKRLGLDWMLTRPNYTVQTNFGPAGNVLAYVQTGNVTANLRAELTENGGKVVNAPIISTLNNRQAIISITNSTPYYTPVIQTTTTGNITQYTPGSLDYQSALDVMPQINGDNSITLTLRPEITDQSGLVKSPDGTQELPATVTQYLSTARRVANGETIVVGGFIKKNDSNSGTKVPILGDLPIIGKLFRSTSDVKQDVETLIFITPTVVPDKSSTEAIGVISP
jgi:type II secretory pathway component GspD/PulD (secretin)